MENTIGKKDKREQVTLTLRESTHKRLQDFKTKHKIDYLSPMIDDMLVDWLNKNEEGAK